MVANVSAAPVKVSPLGGAALDGLRAIYVTGAKNAQNDTLTIANINAIVTAQVMVTNGTTRSVDTFTITEATPTVINLTGSVTGTVHVFALVR